MADSYSCIQLFSSYLYKKGFPFIKQPFWTENYIRDGCTVCTVPWPQSSDTGRQHLLKRRHIDDMSINTALKGGLESKS